MKSLIRYLQNHLLMTNRPGYRKSSGSSPETMIPPYHNFYSIWGHFSEDLLDFFSDCVTPTYENASLCFR